MHEIFREIAVIGLSGFFLAAVSVAMFYEIMAHIWVRLEHYNHRPRAQIFLTIFGIFTAHTLCIWLFGVGFYLAEHYLHVGALKGAAHGDLLSYVYFAAATYTTVGFGDLYPIGPLRMLTSITAITGLLLIGWSVAYTYVMADRYLLHRKSHYGRGFGPDKRQ